MTLSKYASAALLGAVLFAGCALAEPADTAKATGKDASWLFVQTAQGAKFDGKTLTLIGINPLVVMFTDRPVRMAETIAITNFIKDWGNGGKNSFVADPPNAVLTSVVDGKLQTATVELTLPHLEGTTLIYQARVLQGNPPVAGGATSVFIDDHCPSFTDPGPCH